MYKKIKRFLDIVFSSLLLVLLLPLFMFLSLLIKIDIKGPVFFKLERIGKNKQTFKIFKFRSMRVDSEKYGVYELKGDNRVTKVGRILRKTSLDELPQLLNIIKGDMSLIGPRPPLTYHPWPLSNYSDVQLKRFLVRPGVTGLAQINGRKEIDWTTRIQYDIQYIDNLSFKNDCLIFVKTIIKVLFGKNNLNKGKTI